MGAALSALAIHEILDSVGEGLITLDPALKVTSLNAAAEGMFGRMRSTAVDREFFDAFPEFRSSNVGDAIRELPQQKVPVTFEADLESAVGSGQYLVHVFPHDGGGGMSVLFKSR